MDFTAPNEVIEVLKKKASFGIYGYPTPSGKKLDDAFIRWVKRHDLDLDGRKPCDHPGHGTGLLTYAVLAFPKRR